MADPTPRMETGPQYEIERTDSGVLVAPAELGAWTSFSLVWDCAIWDVRRSVSRLVGSVAAGRPLRRGWMIAFAALSAQRRLRALKRRLELNGFS